MTILRNILCTALLATGVLGSLSAAAHPLGNFSINQYWLVDLRGEGIEVHYLLDIAEIPSFREMDRLDTELDEQMSQEEIEAYLEAVGPELVQQMTLTVGGKPLGIRLNREALEVYEGSGGMPVFNIFLDLTVEGWEWPQGELPENLQFRSSAHENAQGYREALVLVDERYKVGYGPWAEGDDDALRYMTLVMEDEKKNPLLQSFYNVFRIDFTDGGGEAIAIDRYVPDFSWTATARIDDQEKVYLARGERVLETTDGEITLVAASSAPSSFQRGDRAQASESELADSLLTRVTNTIRSKETTSSMIAIALLISFILGMGHAFSPGHGKTVMAAYLIGERGTAWHAFVLGVIVTVVHVWSVFLIGLIVLYASDNVSDAQINFWTGLASGLIIVGIGFVLFFRRYRAYIIALHGQLHPHPHEHPHEHDHPHDHHGHHHAHDHSHGPHDHSHVVEREDGLPPTYWNILWLGVSGGIVPCPAALLVLMGAINFGRLGLGMLMITSFSLGLAVVLVAIGIVVVKTSGKIRERIGARSPFLLLLPVMSSVLITALGCMMVFMTLVQFNIIVMPG